MGSRVTTRLLDSLTALPDELKSNMRKIVEKYTKACNVTNGRPIDANFDVSYVTYLSHYFAWLELNKSTHHLSLLDQHNLNRPWNQLKLVNEDSLNDFFIKFVQLRRTQHKSTKKYVSSLQAWVTYIEKTKIIIHSLPEIKSSLMTQSNRRKDIVMSVSHEIDPHSDIPMRNISTFDENRLLQTAIEYHKNGLLTFEESCLFLTTYTNTKQRLIRCESLLKRNFGNRITNSVEGPHRKWSAKTLFDNTGHNHFENTDYLIIPPYGQKNKKENKTMSGSYRHYCLYRCSVFWMAVTTLIHMSKANDADFNFYIDNTKGDTCE